MKRANSSVIALTALAVSPFTLAAETEPQLCAIAAAEVTGDTSYQITDSRTVIFGRDWYELKLAARESGNEIVCRIRDGKVTALQISLPETAEAIAINS